MTKNIGSHSVKGVAWLGSGQLIRIGISLLTSVLMGRLLAPSDFGLFTMTYMAAEMAQLFAAFGFGSAIVQQQTTKASVLSSCFWVNIFISFAISAALLVFSPLVESYFKVQGIAPLLIPLSLNMVLSAAMVVPQSLLTQRLHFRQLTMAQTIGSVGAAATAVTAAYAGMGVWALALQPLIGNIVTSTLLFSFSKWAPERHFAVADVKPLFNFSTSLLANNLIEFFSRNLPTLIVGRVLGTTALGFYGFATGLTGVVVYQISSVIVRVLFPTLAILQSDARAMREAWFKANSAIAVAAWPLMAGAIAVAPDLIPVVFGPSWIPAILPFQILCGLMCVQAVASTANTVLMAKGRADLMLRVTIGAAIANALALWTGSMFSVTGVAIAYALVGAATLLTSTWLAARQAQLALADLLLDLRPWALASVATGLAMAAAHAGLPGLGAGLRLTVCIVVGLLAYPAMLWLVARQRALSLYQEIGSRLRHR